MQREVGLELRLCLLFEFDSLLIIEELAQDWQPELDEIFLKRHRPLGYMHTDAIEKSDLRRPVDRNCEQRAPSDDLPLLADQLELELLRSIKEPE